MLQEISHLVGKDYSDLSAKDFSKLIESNFANNYKIQKEVSVSDRGDGRTGRIDIVISDSDRKIAIELDRLTPRKKSIIKLMNLDATERYVVTRAPVTIYKF